jgi:hypothetical protein
VYGVDRSALGAEIAKVSLWLEAFVPVLALAYLDHNVQVGDSLVGVASPEHCASCARRKLPVGSMSTSGRRAVNR